MCLFCVLEIRKSPPQHEKRNIVYEIEPYVQLFRKMMMIGIQHTHSRQADQEVESNRRQCTRMQQTVMFIAPNPTPEFRDVRLDGARGAIAPRRNTQFAVIVIWLFISNSWKQLNNRKRDLIISGHTYRAQRTHKSTESGVIFNFRCCSLFAQTFNHSARFISEKRKL